MCVFFSRLVSTNPYVVRCRRLLAGSVRVRDQVVQCCKVLVHAQTQINGADARYSHALNPVGCPWRRGQDASAE